MRITTDSDITTRLGRLERNNLRMRLILTGALAGTAMYALAGAAVPATNLIEARCFAVVDEAGNRLAELGLQPDGKGVALSFFDPQGNKRLQLTATEQDAGLSLIQNGELRAALNARRGQHVMLLIQKDKFDEKKNQMGFGFMDDGSPHIFINDGQAKTILSQP